MAESAIPRGKHRLFFALWPDAPVREQIAAVAAPLCANFRSPVVPAGNYHLTLVFLGALSPSGVRDVIAAARGVRFLPFNVELQHSGYWPRSQVAWLAPHTCPAPLATLVNDLQNRLGGLGLTIDARQFRPHVTLARDVTSGFSAPLATTVRWPVRSFNLLESVPASGGPVYRPLAEFFAEAG